MFYSSDVFLQKADFIFRTLKLTEKKNTQLNIRPDSYCLLTRLGKKDGHLRKRRSVSSPSTQVSPTVTPSYVQLLIRDELLLLQNQICAKDQVLCREGPQGKPGR